MVDVGAAAIGSRGATGDIVGPGIAARRRLVEGISAALCRQQDEDSFVQLCRTWHAGLVTRVKAELQGLLDEHQRAHEGELQAAAEEASQRRAEELDTQRRSLEAAASQREDALRAEAAAALEDRLAEQCARGQRELEAAASEASRRHQEELDSLRVSLEAAAAQRGEAHGAEAAALEKRYRAALKKEKLKAKELSSDVARLKKYCSLMHPDALAAPALTRKAPPGVSQGGCAAPAESQLCSRCLRSPASSLTPDPRHQRGGQERQEELAAAVGGLEGEEQEEAEAKGRRKQEAEEGVDKLPLSGAQGAPADRAPGPLLPPPGPPPPPAAAAPHAPPAAPHAAAASLPRPRGPRAPPPRFSETRTTAAGAAASSALRSGDAPRGLRGGGSTKDDAPIEDSEDEIDCVPETDFEGLPWAASWAAAGAHDVLAGAAAAAADDDGAAQEVPLEEVRVGCGGEGAGEKGSWQAEVPTKGGEEEGGVSACAAAGAASASAAGVRSRSRRSAEEAETEARDRVRRQEDGDWSKEDQEREEEEEEGEEEEDEDDKSAMGGEPPSRGLRRTAPRGGKHRRREPLRQLGSSSSIPGGSRSVGSGAARGGRGLLLQTKLRTGDCAAARPRPLDYDATLQTRRYAAAAGSSLRGEDRAEPGECPVAVEFSGIEEAREKEVLQVLRKGAEEAVEEETKEEEEEELKEEERKFAEETMEEGHGRREAEDACYGGDAGGGSSSGSPARARCLTPVWSPTRLQRPEASAEQHPSAFGAVSPRATQQPPCSEATRLPRHGFMDAPGAEDRAEEAAAAAAAAARGQSRRQARVPEPSQEITSRPPAPKQMRLSKQRPNKDSSGSGDEVDSGPLEPSVDNDSTKSDDQVGRRALNHQQHPRATAAEDTGDSHHLSVRSLRPESSPPMPRGPVFTPSPPQPQPHEAIRGSGSSGGSGPRKRGKDHQQGGGGGGGGGPGLKQPKTKVGSSPKWRTKARSRAPRATAAASGGGAAAAAAAAARDPFDLSNLSQASLGVVHVHRPPSSSAAAAPAATGTIQEYFSRRREAAASGGVSLSGGGMSLRDRQQGNAALWSADITGVAATSGISGRGDATNGGGSSGRGRDHQQGTVTGFLGAGAGRPCEAAVAVVAAAPAVAAEQDKDAGCVAATAAAAADGERPDQSASGRPASHPLAGSRWGKAALSRPSGHQAPRHGDRNSGMAPAEGGGSRAGEPSYKFQEVVRKRAEREALPAHDCPGCTRFYAALESWRVDGGSGGPPLPRPACGHVNRHHQQQQPEEAAAGSSGERRGAHQAHKRMVIADGHREGPTRAELDRGRGLASVKELRQEASRHRHRHKPPETPPGFWDMGFMDSLDSRVVGGEE